MNVFAMILILILSKFGGENFIHHAVRRFHKYYLSRNCIFATDLKCPSPELTFWLYTRSTKDNPTKLNLDSLRTAPFVDAPLKILIQEYGNRKDFSDINHKLIPAYFSRGEYNIISVEWERLTKIPCYYAAWHNIPAVSHCIGQFFKSLLAVRTFTSVHMLGFSLGAQLAAWTSNEMDGLARFTGIDPAFPMFGVGSPMLKKPSAKFVDIYYTNCGFLGVWDMHGDVNVYYNVGSFQPGCGCDEICSHKRGTKFYAETIISGGKMKAFPCEGWFYYRHDQCLLPTSTDLVTVGEDMDPTTKHGRYMVFTSDKRPYILDPAVYLDQTSFSNFKKTASGECTTYKALVRLYDGFIRFKRSLRFKKS